MSDAHYLRTPKGIKKLERSSHVRIYVEGEGDKIWGQNICWPVSQKTMKSLYRALFT